MAYNATNPVSVGLATKKDHYDRVFDNTVAIYAGAMSVTSQVANDDLFTESTTQLARGRRQLRQSFRGLHLGTHPDSDAAANKIALLGLGAAVMSSGHEYTGLSSILPLVADITASGAAGLDTGARAASTWYEAWLIGKSSTRANSDLRLMLHRAKDYLQDVSFTTARDATRALRIATGTATDKLEQGITFATAGLCEEVEVELTRTGAVTGNIWFTLEADAAGSPSGTPLATSEKLNAANIYTTAQAVRVIFRTPATLTATLYHLVMQGDYTRSDTVYVAWGGVVAGGYAGGSAKQYSGAAWGAATGVGDFYFRAFITRNDAALTYPSNYDEGCRLGFVYNSAGSVLQAFDQVERTVRLAAAVDSGNFNPLISVIDLSAGLPPVPVTAHGKLGTDLTAISVGWAGVSGGYQFTGAIATSPYWSWIYASHGDMEGNPAPDVTTEFQAVYGFCNAGQVGKVKLQGYSW